MEPTDFGEKRGLSKHILAIHYGKMSFRCQICDAEFYESKGLNKHIESAHFDKKA